MQHYPRWKIIFIVMVLAFGFAFAMPNVLSENSRDWITNDAPSWVPSKEINLGLDLQGGSHILLDVGLNTVFREWAEGIVDSMRQTIRNDGLGGATVSNTGDVVTIRAATDDQLSPLRQAVRTLGVDVDIITDGLALTVKKTDLSRRELITNTINQSIEIIRRRVDETGTNEPVIQRQGDARILVQLPGVDDPERIKKLLGKTAKLGFHLTDDRATRTGRGGAGALVLPMREAPGQELGIRRRPMITGEMLVNAATNFQDGMPVVTFRLDSRGAERFCRISRDNVGKPFAIVLDNEIISAPVLREAICGGQGQISGRFTVQEANDLSLLLRAGALPAPLTIAEERSVGPSLGADSIVAGKKAALVGLALVAVFMLITYGSFGIISIFALGANIVLVFGLLSSLQATLTLPGIAGIVLTIGMAVDANVLIFERIREEFLAGRSVLSAIQSGFDNAFSTIIDANLTGLIAAILLFSFGTGPIKGFAVTLMIGILTTLFTAVMLTRLLIHLWSKMNTSNDLPLVKKNAQEAK